MRRALIVVLGLGLSQVGCGSDGGGTAPPPKPAAAGTKPGQGKKPDKKVATLAVYPKIEDRVIVDPSPPPKLTDAGTKDWNKVVELVGANRLTEAHEQAAEFEKKYGSTEASARLVRQVDERMTIRHAFRERDFKADPLGMENRDPFRSYVVSQPGSVMDTTQPTGEVTEFCKNKKQLIAVNYNLRDLRLVGLVSRGPRKFALFQDTRDYGHVVHRGDCLGREKARVKEIAGGFVTLEIIPEQVANQPPRPTEERSIPLYPEELKLEDLENGGENIEDQPTTAPVSPSSGPSTGPVLPSDSPPGPTAPTQP